MTTAIHTQRPESEHEKRGAAMSSVLAAIFLTGMKLVVGLLTGSLGILAEAAHSGLDLVAALVTFLAVRVSGRPADQEHPYGHGKVENLSALFETLLLLVTCVWIIYEAIQRLFFKSVEVDPSLWAFVVMGVSIAIDVSRSRMLYRVAKKYDSQALEADALHFSTDIWSSAVVIVGLVLVLISERLHLPWLAKADALAAMAVAGIVVWVSLQLGRRTVTALLDGVPASLLAQVEHQVESVAGVTQVERVRIRRSGPDAFADVQLAVGRETDFERTHAIASQAEAAVRQVLPGADVIVHVEPVRTDHEGLLTTIRVLAARHGLGAHGIRVYDLGKAGRQVELHLEVSDQLSLEEAHLLATHFEQALHEAEPDAGQIITHIEPVGDHMAQRLGVAADEAQIRRVLDRLTSEPSINCRAHDVAVRRAGGELHLTFHCTMNGAMSLVDAHTRTERIESLLRKEFPNLGRVVIHVEPGRTR